MYGFANAYSNNITLGLTERLEGGTNAFFYGQLAGDNVALIQGFFEVLGAATVTASKPFAYDVGTVTATSLSLATVDGLLPFGEMLAGFGVLTYSAYWAYHNLDFALDRDVVVPFPIAVPDDLPLDETDPPVDVFYHYTNEVGLAGITSSQLLLPNIQGKVYMTKSFLSPAEVENSIFIGNPFYEGHGKIVVVFYVRNHQRAQIFKDEENYHEYYFTGGTLRLHGQIIYAGPNLIGQ